MTISESYPAIRLRGLSNRILLENWYYVFKKKNLCFLKQCFSQLA